MSILIKGMEMPKSCGNCYMFSFLSDSCRITNYITEEMNDKMLDRRFDNCPLVPVPPHGDLIDKNILYKKTAEWEEQARHLANTAPDAQTFDKWATILTERSAFKFDIADAPTIIEAEEEER